MSYHATGALTSGTAPKVVLDAQALLESMLSKLKSLPAAWASKILYVADAGKVDYLSPQIDEDGYVAWPNAEFKQFETAWATLANHLGLVGLEWRFALRNLPVQTAIQRTTALLVEARKVLKGKFPWAVLLAAVGAAYYFARGTTRFRKVRKSSRYKRRR